MFGTRPEAIKMAPLVKRIRAESEKYQAIVAVTGQHREMLDQVLRIFDIVPEYDLSIMKPGQDLYDITTRILIGMRDVLKEVRPDIVLVHGDTTTSSAAALASFYQQIAVGHVEAGLRTQDIYSPWPEEMNRQITSRIAKYHFAPTELSKKNLTNEGIDEKSIFVTGNTVIDSLHLVLDQIHNDPISNSYVLQSLSQQKICKPLIDAWNVNRKLVLITGHRRENFGEGFLNICNAIKELSIRYPEVDFVYPVHLNPNVIKPVNEILGEQCNCQDSCLSNVHLIEPLDYLPFVYLMSKSYLILTDSGGIQEEAPGLGIPVLVMRDTTERPEAIEAGTALLVGTSKNSIIMQTGRLLDDMVFYRSMSQASNPFGAGNASEKICNVLNAVQQ